MAGVEGISSNHVKAFNRLAKHPKRLKVWLETHYRTCEHPSVVGVSEHMLIVTFFWYGFDKGQSKRAGLRVPEMVLHLLALAGGFPGGWLGRLFFHHKTRKDAFLVILILATVLHLGLAPTLLAG